MRHAFGQTCARTEASREGRKCHVDDLFIACAVSGGCPKALRILEERFIRPQESALLRKGASVEEAGEALQSMRERLLVGAGGGLHKARCADNPWRKLITFLQQQPRAFTRQAVLALAPNQNRGLRNLRQLRVGLRRPR